MTVNVFLVCKRKFSSLYANIISALIANEHCGFGVLYTDSVADRFVLLKVVVLRHRAQLLRATASSEAWKETVFDLELGVDVLSPGAQARFHEGLLKVVTVGVIYDVRNITLRIFKTKLD